MNLAKVVKVVPELLAFGGHEAKRWSGREIICDDFK